MLFCWSGKKKRQNFFYIIVNSVEGGVCTFYLSFHFPSFFLLNGSKTEKFSQWRGVNITAKRETFQRERPLFQRPSSMSEKRRTAGYTRTQEMPLLGVARCFHGLYFLLLLIKHPPSLLTPSLSSIRPPSSLRHDWAPLFVGNLFLCVCNVHLPSRGGLYSRPVFFFSAHHPEQAKVTGSPRNLWLLLHWFLPCKFLRTPLPPEKYSARLLLFQKTLRKENL